MASIRILIPSGAGAPGFAGIARCLRAGSAELRILAGDQNPQAYGRSLADEFRLVPPSDAPDYAQQVLQWAIEARVDLIFPVTTRELLPLAEKAEAFAEAGIALPISTAAALQIALDKGKTSTKALELGLPVPEFKLAQNRYEMAAAARELGYPQKRVCFKPCLGNGSRGFGIIDEQGHHIPYGSEKAGILPLRLEEWMPRWPEEGNPVEQIVAEFLPGREYSSDALFQHGRCLGVWVRSRDKMIGGISVAGECVEHSGIAQACQQLGESLQLHGLIGFQHREDAQGHAKLMEINPRVQGTTSAWEGMGLNLPWALVQMSLQPERPLDLNNPQNGQRFVRFWDERTL